MSHLNLDKMKYNYSFFSSASVSFRIDLMLPSVIDVNESVEILNCKPHNLPNATDVPRKFTNGTFSLFASNSIFSNISFLTD